MNQTKIYDIAGAAGVSLATVSRVLNHPDKVKEATRTRVLIKAINLMLMLVVLQVVDQQLLQLLFLKFLVQV